MGYTVSEIYFSNLFCKSGNASCLPYLLLVILSRKFSLQTSFVSLEMPAVCIISYWLFCLGNLVCKPCLQVWKSELFVFTLITFFCIDCILPYFIIYSSLFIFVLIYGLFYYIFKIIIGEKEIVFSFRLCSRSSKALHAGGYYMCALIFLNKSPYSEFYLDPHLTHLLK